MRGGDAPAAPRGGVLREEVRHSLLRARQDGAAARKTAQPGAGRRGRRVAPARPRAGHPRLPAGKVGGGDEPPRGSHRQDQRPARGVFGRGAFGASALRDLRAQRHRLLLPLRPREHLPRADAPLGGELQLDRQPRDVRALHQSGAPPGEPRRRVSPLADHRPPPRKGGEHQPRRPRSRQSAPSGAELARRSFHFVRHDGRGRRLRDPRRPRHPAGVLLLRRRGLRGRLGASGDPGGVQPRLGGGDGDPARQGGDRPQKRRSRHRGVSRTQGEARVRLRAHLLLARQRRRHPPRAPRTGAAPRSGGAGEHKSRLRQRGLELHPQLGAGLLPRIVGADEQTRARIRALRALRAGRRQGRQVPHLHHRRRPPRRDVPPRL